MDFDTYGNADAVTSGSPKTFTATVASALQGGCIEVRLDSLNAKPVATLNVPHTGGWEEWRTITTSINTAVSGKHDVYLAFTGKKGPKLFSFDNWRFNR